MLFLFERKGALVKSSIPILYFFFFVGQQPSTSHFRYSIHYSGLSFCPEGIIVSQSIMPQLDKFTSALVMSEFAPICLSFVISLLVSLIFLGLLFVNQSQTTRKLPPGFVFPMALGLLSCFVGAFSPSLAFCADTVPSPSDFFTYTSDMLEDSASSGRSSSTSAVNQPLPGEQAMPPALPVMQEAANRALPYPYQNNEIIGGDSVESIQRRLLGRFPSPSAHEIQMARIEAEDLFEVKVDICQVMAGLHPSGDWMGRGARALDNLRTATGEESLSKLLRMREDLQTAGLQSATFRQLADRVAFRADGDQHSAT